MPLTKVSGSIPVGTDSKALCGEPGTLSRTRLDQDEPFRRIQFTTFSLTPTGHGADDGVPVGLQDRLRGDGHMLGQRVENP